MITLKILVPPSSESKKKVLLQKRIYFGEMEETTELKT